MLSEHQLTAQETWDAIAESFDTTRQKPWRFCLDFIQTLKHSEVIADIGCGNGRHLFPSAARCSHVVGVDISMKLLKIVQSKFPNKTRANFSLVHANAVQLPFKDNSFDSILFIASLHNIQGRQNRQIALKEISRVLKPDGSALISVWSRWQKKFYKYFLRQSIMGGDEFGDIDISWRHHNLNVPRFYHLYSKNEFLQELKQADFSITHVQGLKIGSTRFPDNYAAVVRKR